MNAPLASNRPVQLHPVTVKLCRAFQERARAMGLHGIARHQAALTYFIGGWAALEAAGEAKAAEAVAAFAMRCIAVRGYSELERAIAEDDRARNDQTQAIIDGFGLDPNMGSMN